jgi:hypothetical protein
VPNLDALLIFGRGEVDHWTMIRSLRDAGRVVLLVLLCASLPGCAGPALLRGHPVLARWKTAEALAIQLEEELPARTPPEAKVDDQHSLCWYVHPGLWECDVSLGQAQDETRITLSGSHARYIQHRSRGGLMNPASFTRGEIDQTIQQEPAYSQFGLGGFVCERTTLTAGQCFYPRF